MMPVHAPVPSRARGVDIAVITAFVLATVVPGILGVAAVAGATFEARSAAPVGADLRSDPAPLAWASRARAVFEEWLGKADRVEY